MRGKCASGLSFFCTWNGPLPPENPVIKLQMNFCVALDSQFKIAHTDPKVRISDFEYDAGLCVLLLAAPPTISKNVNEAKK